MGSCTHTPARSRHAPHTHTHAHADALCITELGGMDFERERLSEGPKIGALAMVTRGDQVLARLGLKDQTYRESMVNLTRILAGEVLIAVLGLAFLQRPGVLRPSAPPCNRRAG